MPAAGETAAADLDAFDQPWHTASECAGRGVHPHPLDDRAWALALLRRQASRRSPARPLVLAALVTRIVQGTRMFVDHLIAASLCGFAKLTHRRSRPLAGQRARRPHPGVLCQPPQPRRFRADLGLLPPALRQRTRPGGGATTGSFRPQALPDQPGLPRRNDRPPPRPSGPQPRRADGRGPQTGDSLILFPEGTRNLGEGLLPFKSGLYHLARAHPEAEARPGLDRGTSAG